MRGRPAVGLACLGLALAANAWAGERDRPVWLNLGVGAGDPGVANSINLNVKPGKTLTYQLGYVHNETFQLLGGEPDESGTSAGLLLGRSWGRGAFSLSGFCGIGRVSGFYGFGEFTSSGTVPRDKFLTTGALANLQLFWNPAGLVGLGLDLHGCYNSEISFSSVNLALQFGGR
ncbi:MAG: hypothetical protein WC326_13270 [Candidatus Delongbacteria bacterium]